MNRFAALTALAVSATTIPALGAGGPLGIDHRLAYDDSGIWKRRNQIVLQDATAVVVIAGALWEGGESRLGHTFWQSFDSVLLGTAASSGLKLAFSRSRPIQTDDPDRWFQGQGHNSFPSGEVMEITTAITPFIVEYAADHPAVWALELLAAYDAVARMPKADESGGGSSTRIAVPSVGQAGERPCRWRRRCAKAASPIRPASIEPLVAGSGTARIAAVLSEPSMAPGVVNAP